MVDVPAKLAAIEAVRRRLHVYYSPAEADRWLTSPHPQLSGMQPFKVIDRGGSSEVHAIIDRLDADAYI